MGHSSSDSWLSWFVVIAIIIVVALFFRPVRVWLWGMWQWFRGRLLGKRAAQYMEVDASRVGSELDDGFRNIKQHYVKETGRDIQRFTGGPQKRLIKRLGTLRKKKEHVAALQARWEAEIIEEQKNPPRERPRIKGLVYIVIAALLAFADIAITFMCLQTLGYPIIFLIPSAIMLGVIGFFAGDFLGKNIEPAQKNPNPEKNRLAIILLAAFSAFYCVIFGTMRFLYTQHDPNVSLALNLFGSYGFIAIIVGCSVMLGWLHEGVTAREQLESAKRRATRIGIAIDRCDKQGAKMTEAFGAHLAALESESALVRSQFRNGFDTTWPGRAPYGVEDTASPLELDDDLLKSIEWIWSDTPDGNVSVKSRSARRVDNSRYVDPALLSPDVPAPMMRAAPSPARAVQDGPPPIG